MTREITKSSVRDLVHKGLEEARGNYKIVLKLFNIMFVTIAIAIAGMMSFITANALVDARATGREPSPILPKLMKAATGIIGVGLGGFLMMWLDSLS